MPSAQTNFQIETLDTTALIFASQNPFTQQLQQAISQNNCQAKFLNAFQLPQEEIDYAIFLPSSTQISNLSSFLTQFSSRFPQTKLFLLLSPELYQVSFPALSQLTTIYLGEIYDCHFLHPQLAPYLYHFLASTQLQHQITIPGDGLFSLFPLSQADAIRGLINIIFDPYLQSTQIILQSLHDVSLLSLAHQLKALVPFKLDLVFSADAPLLYSPPPEKAVSFQSLTSFMEEGVFSEDLACLLKLKLKSDSPAFQPKPVLPPKTQSFKKSHLPTPRPRLKPLFPTTSKPPSLDEIRHQVKFVKLPAKAKASSKHPKFKRLIKPLTIFFVLVFTHLLSLVLAGTIFFFSAKRSLTSLSQFQSPSKQTLIILKTSLSYLDFNFHNLAKLPGLTGSSTLHQADQLSQLILYPGIPLLQQISPLSQNLFLFTQHLFGKQSVDNPAQLFNQISSSLDSLYANLSFLSLKLPDKLVLPYLNHYQSQYLQFKTKLAEVRHQVFIFKTISPQLPNLLGVGGTKKYLLLLQNNMELRPTGGFIGSLVTLEFSDAQLFNFQILDVYQLDGQLKGHVKPPEPIKKYLGEASWYLRDSNWDPNYPVTAKRVEWFARKTAKQDFDGVFALNLNFIQQLLRQLGPIKLPDYQETITADNLFERTEYHAEIKSFPGSTQKRDFLSALANQLILRFQTTPSPKDLQALLSTSLDSLTSHDLLLYVNDPQVNSIFDLFGWDGRLQSPQCPLNFKPDSCFQDYLYLVDANLGVNKANYFVRRAINLQLNLSKDLTLSHQLVINYTNTATSNEWPAGPYKNYQRVYLPYDVDSVSVKVGDQVLSSNQIDLERVGGKTIVGYLFQVPINQSLTITLSYQSTKPISQTSPFVYSLYWQRQSGTGLDPLAVNLHYPLYLHPQIVSPEAQLNSQQLNFQLTNSRDRRITIQFKK